MNSYCVYVHQNKINGKRYIGITGVNPLIRWRGGQGYPNNPYFTNAIMKYGWDNFEHIILFSELTRDEACQKEQELIALYKTQDRAYGYNRTSGGDFFHHSEESKVLMSRNRMGKGKQKKSEKTRALMKEHHAGGTDKRPVLCLESNTCYACISDAARAVGINKKVISNCCHRKPHYLTAGGFHWRFADMTRGGDIESI